jgi:hypothetical protein
VGDRLFQNAAGARWFRSRVHRGAVEGGTAASKRRPQPMRNMVARSDSTLLTGEIRGCSFQILQALNCSESTSDERIWRQTREHNLSDLLDEEGRPILVAR